MTKNKKIILIVSVVAIVAIAVFFVYKKYKDANMKLNVKDLKTSKKGLNLIKEHEGLKLKAYKDARVPPVWTIGYGHTKGVYPGQTITEAEATEFLKQDLETAEKIVKNAITVPLTQNQFDALVSHTFNTNGSSLLFKLVNGKETIVYDGTTWNLAKWWKGTWITAGASGILAGLVRRRKEEYELFTA